MIARDALVREEDEGDNLVQDIRSDDGNDHATGEQSVRRGQGIGKGSCGQLSLAQHGLAIGDELGDKEPGGYQLGGQLLVEAGQDAHLE